MQQIDSTITTESSNPQIMSYYLMIRETIHGLDRLIVTVIYQSVTIITSCLTFGILLFEKVGDPLTATFIAFFLTSMAFLLTGNSNKRIKFYANMLVQEVQVAKELENWLFSKDSIKITWQIEKNVEYAGMRGESLFLRITKIFYVIEAVLCIYFVGRVMYMVFWR